jgi:hypothetical protein
VNNLVLLRGASVLWGIWGVFHLFIGVALLIVIAEGHPEGQLSAIPGILNIDMMGSEGRFTVVPMLQQNAYNLAWFGVVVTVGCVYVWRRSANAIFLCTLIGGLADFGYFIYVDLPGYADPPGPQMTYIMATAIALSWYVYFKSDRLRAV